MKKILFALALSAAFFSCNKKKNEDPEPAAKVIHDTVFAYSVKDGVNGAIIPFIAIKDKNTNATLYTYGPSDYIPYTASSTPVSAELKLKYNLGKTFPAPGSYNVQTGAYYETGGLKGSNTSLMDVSYYESNGKIYISVSPIIDLD